MSVPYPYVWHDVALVHFFAALPLALLLAAEIRARCTPFVTLVICAVSLGLGIMIVLAAVPPDTATGSGMSFAAALLRSLPTLAIVLAAVLAIGLLRGTAKPAAQGRTSMRAAAIAISAVALLLIPPVYVRARAKHDAVALVGLVEQSRWGEARSLARAILAIDPEAKFKNLNVPRAAAQIENEVAALEQRVAASLPDGASPTLRLDRAQALAMLGRTGEALAVLESLPEPTSPEACGLRTTIHETKNEFAAARDWYEKARGGWEPREPSEDRSEGLRQALAGVAYCDRKLGRYAEAEAAYKALLELAPTAETHFLLAQFYEDAQQAGLARTHARRAIELAPQRYRVEGEKLIDKLVTTHFGCLSVSSAEWEQPRGSYAARR